jgi:quercetin dioxygenase-like cupin family protein
MAEKLGRHEDDRGVITDLLITTLSGVTEITTRAGAIRGNHIHQRTTQWTYVVSGRMTFAWTEDDGVHTSEHGPGELITEQAGVPHAWKAVTDTRVLVFTKGPRSGQAYETDTHRLQVPILS